ncbi:MAG: type II toxin-antitoxin system RelE/ParE family toxin [Aquidulcibacter sp.]|nr:type II toxin-antitoxin system RelE/ParE family toxin [Aquidulcibacter sp.]
MKRLDFQLSEVAIEELSAIQDQLWQVRPGCDVLFTEQLESVIDRLRLFPESGEAKPDLMAGIRAVPLWQYMIFYRVAEDFLIIEHVIHGARDIEALI